jgi:hypothetical protein
LGEELHTRVLFHPLVTLCMGLWARPMKSSMIICGLLSIMVVVWRRQEHQFPSWIDGNINGSHNRAFCKTYYQGIFFHLFCLKYCMGLWVARPMKPLMTICGPKHHASSYMKNHYKLNRWSSTIYNKIVRKGIWTS